MLTKNIYSTSFIHLLGFIPAYVLTRIEISKALHPLLGFIPAPTLIEINSSEFRQKC